MRSEPAAKPRALILYHYFHPDDVVSARHLTELAEGLQARGWQVIAMPCNRGCRDERRTYRAFERWKGMDILRVWRPRFRQASALGRILNAIWMIGAWSAAAFRRGRLPDIDVVIVGTDPILSVLVAAVWKHVRPRTRVAHWAFDLYPESAVADGFLRSGSLAVGGVRSLLKVAYGACDLIVDIGPCMREALRLYGSDAQCLTLPPWALVEPPEPLPTSVSERKAVFGDVRLALSYSGNFGRAHSYKLLLALARRLRGEKAIRFAFSIRGNRAHTVRKAVTEEDTNITFVPFAPIERLCDRLSAADIHLVSLRSEWTGAVVPSKFFGALAVGRPVIFAGSADSGVARWIREHRVGWLLTPDTLDVVGEDLRRLADVPEEMTALRRRCHDVYTGFFSRESLASRWDEALRAFCPTSRRMA